jgi:hypothetical protein
VWRWQRNDLSEMEFLQFKRFQSPARVFCHVEFKALSTQTHTQPKITASSGSTKHAADGEHFWKSAIEIENLAPAFIALLECAGPASAAAPGGEKRNRKFAKNSARAPRHMCVCMCNDYVRRDSSLSYTHFLLARETTTRIIERSPKWKL